MEIQQGLGAKVAKKRMPKRKMKPKSFILMKMKLLKNQIKREKNQLVDQRKISKELSQNLLQEKSSPLW